MPSPQSNQHVSAGARKLIQSLTATRAELLHNHDTERWYIVTGPSELMLSAAQVKAAREILHLCLLETSLRRTGQTWYKLTKEAVKVLLDPGHIPVFLRTKVRSSLIEPTEKTADSC